MNTESVTRVVESLEGVAVPRNSIQRKMALGLSGVAAAHQVWFVVGFNAEVIAQCELHLVEQVVDPEQEFRADICVLAGINDWLRIGRGGIEEAILAADERRILVSGKLPYFIRNVRSFIDVLVVVGAVIAAEMD